MGRYSVKRYKTKRRTRDLDLIQKDLQCKATIEKLKNQPLDENKPGLGQYYDIPCDKYFETQEGMNIHMKSKKHKRRLKELNVLAYSPEEANAAAGVDLIKYTEKVQRYNDTINSIDKTEFQALINQQKPELDKLLEARNEELATNNEVEMKEE